MSKKVVRARYTACEEFVIPDNINLEDNSVVESWGVKWNILYINLINGKTIEIQGKGYLESNDYKWPDDVEIADNDDE